MVCSCGVVSKGCHICACNMKRLHFGVNFGIERDRYIAVFPLSGCGQFGKMLVAMSTGDQSSHQVKFTVYT